VSRFPSRNVCSSGSSCIGNVAASASRVHIPGFTQSLRVMPVLRDERTPFPAKLFLGLAIGYLCMPFDLIPDFIPVIGHLDDAVVIPALVFAALCFVPREIVSEHREQVICEQAATSGKD
jgi:uncharacterized membrane protein YkvA (DUF1232 family)